MHCDPPDAGCPDCFPDAFCYCNPRRRRRVTSCKTCVPARRCTNARHPRCGQSVTSCVHCSPSYFCLRPDHGSRRDGVTWVTKHRCPRCYPGRFCFDPTHGSVPRTKDICFACSPHLYCVDPTHRNGQPRRRSTCPGCSPHLYCADAAHGNERPKLKLRCIPCGGKKQKRYPSKKGTAAPPRGKWKRRKKRKRRAAPLPRPAKISRPLVEPPAHPEPRVTDWFPARAGPAPAAPKLPSRTVLAKPELLAAIADRL